MYDLNRLAEHIEERKSELRHTTFKQWADWSREPFNLLPVIVSKPLPVGKDATSWIPVRKRQLSPYHFVLESGKTGRYTYVGNQIEDAIEWKDDRCYRYFRGKQTIFPDSPVSKFDPFSCLRQWLGIYRAPKVDGVPRFIGGAVGFFSYDAVRYLEKLPDIAADELRCPDYSFMRVHQLWVIDHVKQRIYYSYYVPLPASLDSSSSLMITYDQAVSEAEEQLDWFLKRVYMAGPSEEELRRKAWYTKYQNIWQQTRMLEEEGEWTTSFAKADYMKAVEKVKEYIRSGDVFQVNLSLRRGRPYQGSTSELYEWLRLINPSPYMGYLHFPAMDIVSASPELLVKLDGGKMTARPIAGTRRRGHTRKEEEAFIKELMENEKERAEHVMLVDLERNDLGRVSRYGTVKVDELMTIEFYSHVMHLVSEVTGQLREDLDSLDAIQATFPGGTITGAPKVRTMEIIEELEPVKRGPYTGSMGWIDYQDNMEFNIIIRTLFIKDKNIYLQAGAGIVMDSEPEREYKESINKARALIKALAFDELERNSRRDSP